MMRIKSISTSPDPLGRYSVRMEDDSVLRLYRQTIEEFGLFAGRELESEELRRIHESAGVMSAKMRAVRIVSATNVSKGDLQRRLIQKGEDPAQAADAVRWMEELDLLDDARTAEQIVSSCARKGYGISRAKQALYEKRIPKSYWEDALSDYPNQTEYIISFFKSRLGEHWDAKDLKRATDALIRRGHSYSDIRCALRRMELDAEDFLEE